MGAPYSQLLMLQAAPTPNIDNKQLINELCLFSNPSFIFFIVGVCWRMQMQPKRLQILL
jgi:hypothetical protein